MLIVRQNKVEKFFDLLDESTMIYYNKVKKDYLESLLISCDNISHNTIKIEDLMPEDIDNLERLYDSLEGESFNKDEIRRAFTLALFKALKHIDVSLSDITPDAIGILFAYFVNILFKDKESIQVLDATCGTGNLFFSMLNNCEISLSKLYGVDVNSSYINIALHLADLLEYEVEFFNQDNLKKMLIPQVELIIGDLPIDHSRSIPEDLVVTKSKSTYKPYLMVENLFRYSKPGGYLIYLIPNDFFNHENNQVIKDIILSESYIQALIELPTDLFKDTSFQKSILILRKKGEGIKPIKDILMQRFPSFKDPEKVNQTIQHIKQWFLKSIK